MRVVIVGGGAMGSSLAYWLTREPRFAGEVVVVERDPSYARASSALSASGIRQQFSSPVNVAIGLFGIDFLRHAALHLAVDGAAPDIPLDEGGYLYLATAAGRGILEANHAVQRRLGADVALLDPSALRTRFPWLATEGVVLASLGVSGEGWFDGYALTRAFRAKAIAQGAHYVRGEVIAVTGEAVELADGDTVSFDLAVNAAGPWAGRLGRLFGVEIPVHARRRTVLVLSCPEPPSPCPLVIDPSGVWFRRERDRLIAGCPPLGEDADDLPLEPEYDLFEERIWPALAARAPCLERLKLAGAWAGYYEMNTFDHNGLVGQHPDRPDLLLMNGFSGHGIQQAPAVGRGVAELIVHGRYTTLDLTPLDPGRVARGEPLVERNVI